MMKWSFLTMVAERKVQLRADDDYPMKMGSNYIIKMNSEVGKGRAISLIAFVQNESVKKGITTKAYCAIWAEKYIAEQAFADVILHLQNMGMITHAMAKVDLKVSLNENFRATSRLEHWSTRAPYPALVRHDDCEVVCAFLDRSLARQQEDWEDSYVRAEGSVNMSVNKTEIDDNPLCLIG